MTNFVLTLILIGFTLGYLSRFLIEKVVNYIHRRNFEKTILRSREEGLVHQRAINARAESLVKDFMSDNIPGATITDINKGKKND